MIIENIETGEKHGLVEYPAYLTVVSWILICTALSLGSLIYPLYLRSDMSSLSTKVEKQQQLINQLIEEKTFDKNYHAH